VKDNLQILKRPKEEHISLSHDSYTQHVHDLMTTEEKKCINDVNTV